MSEPSRAGRIARIAVIVVNYGTAELAVRAVESVLARRHGGRSVKVHLVDNASPGSDALRLAEAHDAKGWGAAVTLWPERENHGFGRGNNVVLKALARQNPPDAVFLLNPDACLENEAIDILADALEAAPDAVAAGAGLRSPDGTPQTAAFRFPGPANEVMRIINLSLLHRLTRNHQMALPPTHPAGPVDWVSGACVMFRFDAIRQTGFFDAGFFLYYEEVDLMRQLKERGGGTLYVPQAKVVHEAGSATGQFDLEAERQQSPAYLYQSWTHYFTRAYGRSGALVIALSLWPAALLNILHRRLRRRTPTLPLHFFTDHWRYVLRPLITGAGRQ